MVPCVCICVSHNACHTILNEWQQLGNLKMDTRNVPVQKATALHETSTSYNHITSCLILVWNLCQEVPGDISLLLLHQNFFLCLELILLTRDVQRLGEIIPTCRLTSRCLPHSSLFVIHTQRENQLNLRYMVSPLFKKKKKHLWKKSSQSSIAWQCIFFCLCWEICHHTPTYYLEWEKRVDARTFSRL